MTEQDNEGQKIVDFGEYCPICQNWETKENELPCSECLESATNLHTTKPVKFKLKVAK